MKCYYLDSGWKICRHRTWVTSQALKGNGWVWRVTNTSKSSPISNSDTMVRSSPFCTNQRGCLKNFLSPKFEQQRKNTFFQKLQTWFFFFSLPCLVEAGSKKETNNGKMSLTADARFLQHFKWLFFWISNFFPPPNPKQWQDTETSGMRRPVVVRPGDDIPCQ